MNRLIATRPGWETVVCIAGGPSLSAHQCDLVQDARRAGLVKALGVNNAYQRADLDALFACDLQWWKKYRADGAHGQGWQSWCRQHPGAETVTQDASAHKQFALATRIRGCARDGLGLHEIHTGGNGGHAAVNLAYLWGASRIILLGYDMKPGPNGEKHWHADHPSPCLQMQLFAQWIHRFKSTADDLERRGVKVVNCTPDSALPWFPMGHLAETLQAWQPSTVDVL